MTELPTDADFQPPLIWLLRSTAQQYRRAIQSALEHNHLGDLPRQGYWIVNALDGRDRPAGELVDLMQITKQAVSQLVDALVALGYVERHDDPSDRRRVSLRLSAKGRLAAVVIMAASDALEERVVEAMGPEALNKIRALLNGYPTEQP